MAARNGPARARRKLGALLQQARTTRGWSVAEVAERAGVGASWYAWLEAGRNLALSPVVLAWVSKALALTPAIRVHLAALAGLDDSLALQHVRAELVPTGCRDMLSGVPRFPAYITGRRGDVLAWNEPSEALYRCSTIPVARRNTLLFLFGQPDVRRLVVNWDEQAQRVVHAYRKRVRTDPKDEWLGEPHALLMGASAEFPVLWERAETTTKPAVTFVKIFQKRGIGRLTFRVEELIPADASDLTLSIYVPEPHDETGRRLDKLLARHHQGGRAGEVRAQRHRIVRGVKDHLDATYAHDLPAEEIASLFGMDRYRLSRMFADEVGFPPHAYRLLVRIEHAKRFSPRRAGRCRRRGRGRIR